MGKLLTGGAARVVVVLALALSGATGCARNHYPGAAKEDIKFCRLEARLVAPVNQGSTFNDCMESLGYAQ